LRTGYRFDFGRRFGHWKRKVDSAVCDRAGFVDAAAVIQFRSISLLVHEARGWWDTGIRGSGLEGWLLLAAKEGSWKEGS
jgi:hypothetical protein